VISLWDFNGRQLTLLECAGVGGTVLDEADTDSRGGWPRSCQLCKPQMRVPPVPRIWGPGNPPASTGQSLNLDRSWQTPIGHEIDKGRIDHAYKATDDVLKLEPIRDCPDGRRVCAQIPHDRGSYSGLLRWSLFHHLCRLVTSSSAWISVGEGFPLPRPRIHVVHGTVPQKCARNTHPARSGILYRQALGELRCRPLPTSSTRAPEVTPN
jgi:hypothetical protein